MPKRTNEFQGLVKRIYAALSGTGTSVEESVLVQEKNSQAKREVDVLITTKIAGHEVRVAIECRDHTRDQDITWIDSLIGQYANLPINKVIAISHTKFAESASEKAAQHNIELMTLVEAEQVDWAKEIGPSLVQFFAYRNWPCVVMVFLGPEQQLMVEYERDGTIKSNDPRVVAFGRYFCEAWKIRMSHIAGHELGKEVFGNFGKLEAITEKPRYWEITEQLPGVITLSMEGHLESVCFDRVVWGIGTTYSSASVEPAKWVLQDKAAIVTSAVDDRGNPVNITFVTDQNGRIEGIDVDST